MNDSFAKTILVFPLDWGLGHTTRCIPIIHQFIQANFRVVVGCTPQQKAVLQNEFSGLVFEMVKGYNIKYSHKRWLLALSLLLRLPSFIGMYFYERQMVHRLRGKYLPSLVISDNRFFCTDRAVPSIYITHQLRIRFPRGLQRMEFVGIWLHRAIQRAYDYVWIPDSPQAPGIAGELSHIPLPEVPRYVYIGALSRFQVVSKEFEPVEPFDILVILSGPEPQRSLLEKIILEQLLQANRTAVLLRALPLCTELPKEYPNVRVLHHANTTQMNALLSHCNLVISRSGYTTVMDLAYKQKKAILIPTPGQTEQEYLAQLYSELGYCLTCTQEQLHIEAMYDAAIACQGFPLVKPTVPLVAAAMGHCD